LNNLDYKAGIYPELCFCLGIENLLQVKPPKRSTFIRMLLCELFRIACHLSYIADMSVVLGNMAAFNYTLTDKEKILNIIELITGSRIIPNFIRIGGVKKDVDENVLESLHNLIPKIYKSIKRIEDLFSSDVVMLEKLKYSGIANGQSAKEAGVTGPNLRASGVRHDLRKTSNYLLYKDIAFTIPLGRIGDNFDRVLIRFKEIYQSLKIISEIAESMPLGATGKMINTFNLELYPSRIISTVECPHGIFKLYIEVKENRDIEIIPISSIKNNMILCEKTLRNCSFDELLPIVSSFGIESPEMY
jgi:NADH-quinone oxidoreductase subunit D